MAWTTILPEVVNSIATRVDAAACPAGYLKDKILWHDGNLYQCQEDITAETAWTDVTKLKPVVLADLFEKGEGKFNTSAAGNPYAAGNAYDTGDYCTFEDDLYKANKPITSAPAVFVPDDWDKITAADEIDLKADRDDIADWYTPGTAYEAKDVVYYKDNLYRAKEDIVSAPADFDSTKWDYVQVKDLITKQLTAGEPWDDTKAYHKDDIVQKDDFLWICNVENATVGTFSKEAGSQRKQFNMSETDLGTAAAGTLMPAAIGQKYHVHEIEFPAEYADDFANGNLWITGVDVKSGGSEYTNKRIESTTVSGIKCANITGASVAIYPGITAGKYYVAGPNAYAGPNSPTWFKIDIASDPEWSKYYVHEASGSDIRKNIAEIEDSSKTYETGDTIWESETDLKYVDETGSKQDVNIRSMIEAVVDYLREYSGLDIKWGWDSTNSLPILKAEKAWDFIKHYDFSAALSGAPNENVVFYGAVRMKQLQKLTVINSKPDMYSVGIVGTHIKQDSSQGLQRYEKLVANMDYDNNKNLYLLKDPSVSFRLEQPYPSDSATKYAQDTSGRSYFYTSGNFTFDGDKNIGLAFIVIKKVGGGAISSDEIKDIYESINYNVIDRADDYDPIFGNT